MHQSERVRQSAADCDYNYLSIYPLPTTGIDRIALLQCEGLPSSPDGAPTFRVGPSSSESAQFSLESDGTQLEPSRQIILYYKYHTATVHPLPPSWATHHYSRPQPAELSSHLISSLPNNVSVSRKYTFGGWRWTEMCLVNVVYSECPWNLPQVPPIDE